MCSKPAARPAGVTLAACLLAATSGVTVVVGTISVLGTFRNAPRSEFAGFGVMAALVLAAAVAVVATLEVATAIGLWRMRGWARTSVLLMSGLMLALPLLGVTSRYARLEGAAAAANGMMLILAIVALAYFLRPSVRRMFAETDRRA